MSAMKNLDLICQQASATPEEYDETQTLISMHLNGEIDFKELPIHIQTLLMEWENDELELNSKEIVPWENY